MGLSRKEIHLPTTNFAGAMLVSGRVYRLDDENFQALEAFRSVPNREAPDGKAKRCLPRRSEAQMAALAYVPGGRGFPEG